MQRLLVRVRQCLLGRRTVMTAKAFRRRFAQIDFRTRQNPAYRLSRWLYPARRSLSWGCVGGVSFLALGFYEFNRLVFG